MVSDHRHVARANPSAGLACSARSAVKRRPVGAPLHTSEGLWPLGLVCALKLCFPGGGGRRRRVAGLQPSILGPAAQRHPSDPPGSLRGRSEEEPELRARGAGLRPGSCPDRPPAGPCGFKKVFNLFNPLCPFPRLCKRGSKNHPCLSGVSWGRPAGPRSTSCWPLPPSLPAPVPTRQPLPAPQSQAHPPGGHQRAHSAQDPLPQNPKDTRMKANSYPDWGARTSRSRPCPAQRTPIPAPGEFPQAMPTPTHIPATST